jgi:hypothetical protein
LECFFVPQLEVTNVPPALIKRILDLELVEVLTSTGGITNQEPSPIDQLGH